MKIASIFEELEGRTIDGKFALLERLGSSEDSAVFLTLRLGGQRSLIKLVRAGGVEADTCIARWNAARALSHPHLMRIFETGRTTIDGAGLAYVVTENADEILSTVLRERALDPLEARDTFGPILDALSYLHATGIIHGHVKPSNALRIGDAVKLSADDFLVVPGVPRREPRRGAYDAPELASGRFTPAADVWSIGMMLCEAMTRQLPQLSVDGGLVVPDSLPRSLASIAQECLRFNPDRRCTISDMIARLAPGLTLPPEILSPGRWAAHPTPSPAREDPRPADPLPSGELAADGGKPNDIKPEGIQIVEAEVPLQPLSASGDGPRDGNNTQSPRSGAPPAPSRWEEDPPEEVNQFGPEPLRRGASAGNSQPRPASQWQSKWESDTSTPLPDLFKQFDDKEPRRFRVLPFLLVALVLLGLTGTILVRSGRIDLPTLEKLAQDKIASLTQSVSPQQQAQAPSPQPAESPAVTQAAAPPQTPPATQPDQPQPAPATETPSASPQQATTPPAGAEPQPASATPQPSQSATEAAPPQVPAAPPTPARTEEPLPASADGAVARQVMPSVSQAAIESMHGPVRVTLRVAVSRTGDVSSASYISPGEGNYFARIAHRAAEQWKFHAPRHRGRPDASTWTLRFNFTRDGVDVTAAQD